MTNSNTSAFDNASFFASTDRNCTITSKTTGRKLQCPSCQSEAIYERILEQGTHYSRVECAECGRFIKWGKKPETEAKKLVLASQLNHLSNASGLTDWEQSFVQSVLEQFELRGKLSPKQVETVDRLYLKVGGGK